MKPSFILGVAIGYVVGSRVGRPPYDDIVAGVRRVAGSKNVRAASDVMQAQVHDFAKRAKYRLGGKPTTRRLSSVPAGINGHYR